MKIEFQVFSCRRKLWAPYSNVQDWQNSCQVPNQASNHDELDNKAQSFRQFELTQQIHELFLAVMILIGAEKSEI